MPRTNYLPDRHTPLGYAMTYQRAQYEDKPTIEVDLFDQGMQYSLVEAVCVALETWDPVFDHWSEPTPRYDQNGKEISSRKIPVFRGRHAHKVQKFYEDISQYLDRNPTEQQKNVYVKIASKYVNIRPTTRFEGQAPLPHQDITHYNRDIIRPVIRREDPEWDKHLMLEVSRQSLRQAKDNVATMLLRYDKNHGTVYCDSFEAEFETLDETDAHNWEHWRLIAHYVQNLDSH